MSPLLLMDTTTGGEPRPDDIALLSTKDALAFLADLSAARTDMNALADALRGRLERARAEGDLDGGTGNDHGFLWKRSAGARWDAPATAAVLDRLAADGTVPAPVAAAAAPEVTVRKPDGRRLSSLLIELGRTHPEAAADLAACNRATPYWKAEQA